MFLFELAVILTAAQAAGTLSRKLSQPSVLGQIIAGIIIGPSFLSVVDNTELISEMAEIGVILLMFIAGLETNVNELKKSGKSSTAAAIGGVFLPFFGGGIAAYCFGLGFIESVFIGTILTATSVSISVQTLLEIGKLKSCEGITILGAAVIDDILGIIALTLVTGYAVGGSNILLLLVKIIVFFGLFLMFGKKLIQKISSSVVKTRSKEGLFTTAIIIIFITAFAAEQMGVAAIIGAYIVGIAFGATQYRRQISEKVQVMAYSLFVPIFFISIGVKAELSHFNASLGFAAVLTFVAILTKIIGCGIGARISGLDLQKSWRIGIGMISRGEVALIVASLGQKMGIINESVFCIIVVMVIFTSLITPVLLKWSFKDEVFNQQAGDFTA
ncbi:MAG: hypothetical protein PWQ82_1457 [Thermosediminibacterales bacterium]|nr:hypothetical protein [Thermosediminibacterales bacterium]MDK2836034.1 hypothetical protein [Thermosediminibacterales bacterium]